ncbi:BZ3500_MvSof-1268-A1-R1_Chr8-1g10024 [Microbotryum saponariae]|uniref:Autophagy-related protein 2 n=1 Tax=Microbotryum saponariae TaxID=289078 RepID=A0A2X0KQD2_9BASI|nr:BZ3500_MvSof-1268-A1-R1_Chr8-1g10024 [Microbotryum saponariae]SDA08310.1 BZ3501_MvSof-1269-A2-R1_Chr8-1g09747 [Microbotryum saponariae]
MSPWSYLASYLPSISLSSLPLPSLPAKLQHRLLAFLLRRSIGNFVKGQFDDESIEADLGNGLVKLQALELNPEAIEPLLSGLPFSFVGGTIGQTIAQVSLPLSLSSRRALSLQVDDLYITLKVQPFRSSSNNGSDVDRDDLLSASHETLDAGSSSTTRARASQSHRRPTSPPDHREDEDQEDERDEAALAESILSVAVASEFVKHQLDEKDDAALRQSLHLSFHSEPDLELPGAFGSTRRGSTTAGRTSMDEEQTQEVTMLAGLIDRILARLQVRVRNLKVTLLWEDDEEEHQLVFSSDEIVYEETERDQVPDNDGLIEDVLSQHQLSIIKPGIRLKTGVNPGRPGTPRPTQPAGDDDASSTESEESEESEDQDLTPEHDMMMSQSIADLRTSFMSAQSCAAMGESVYASARGSIFERSSSNQSSIGGHQSSDNDSDSNPFLEGEAEPIETDIILSFGSEPIAVSLTSTATPKSPTPAEPEDLSPRSNRAAPPKLEIRSTISGPITMFVLPDQIRCFLQLAELVTSHLPPSTQTVSRATQEQARSASLNLTIAIGVKLFQLIVAHSPSSRTPSATQLDTIWAHPTTSNLPCDHLRLRLEGMGAFVERHSTDPPHTIFPLRSFSLVESLCTTTSEGQVKNTTLPILVSDPDLQRQYNVEDAFPTFDLIDWKRNKLAEGKGWRTRLKPRLGIKAMKPEEPAPAAIVTVQSGSKSIRLQPIHLFLDLSFVERLQTFVSVIGTADSSGQFGTRTPRPSTPVGLNRPHDRSAPFTDANPPERATSGLDVNLSVLRISIRCPPPKGSFGWARAWDDSVRSGIVVLDLHDLAVSLLPRSPDDPIGTTTISVTRALAFFAPPPSNDDAWCTARALLSLTHLAHHPVEERPRVPLIKIRQQSVELAGLGDSSPQSPTSADTSTTTVVECSLPLLRASVGKMTLDGLQLFADDLAQWSFRLADARIDDSSTDFSIRSERNPKMISSRYFGAKSFSRGRARADSESEDSSGDLGVSAMTVKVEVTDLVLDLWLDKQVQPPGPSHEGKQAHRHLRALAADVDIDLHVLRNSQNDLRAIATFGNVTFEEPSNSSTNPHIFARTMAPRPTAAASDPVLRIDFTSSVEKLTSLKESKVQLTLSNFTYFFTAELDWTRELSTFAKAPAGAFETVVPNELTRIRLNVNNGSIHVTSSTLDGSQLVVSIGQARVATNLMPDMPRTVIIVEPKEVRLLVVEGPGDLLPAEDASRELGYKFWKTRGFAELAHLERSSIQIRQGNGLVLPDFELEVADSMVKLSICADSMSCVSAIVDDVLQSAFFRPSATESPVPAPRMSTQRVNLSQSSVDVLASLDPSAFEHAKPLVDYPEILADDVPTNLAYLADALQQTPSSRGRQTPPPPGPGHKASTDRPGEVISDIDGETIRMLDPKGLRILDEYLAVPREEEVARIGCPPSITRCRVSNCDISIMLHEGYDWHSTRKAIQDERKAIRRRLERIRQLLASGQTADASAEQQASVLVFGSVQLGLLPGAFELPPKELLAAINEELNDTSSDVGEEASAASVSSWQTMPSGAATPNVARTSRVARTAVGKSRNRLTRSTSHAIEINLTALSAQFDAFGAMEKWASRIRIDVDAFDILDNVKTSTWRKFLTELRPVDGGVPRTSGTSMARVELDKMRPVGRSVGASEELALKIKISPLRLYVDQDALDFLKAFGAFQAPNKASKAGTAERALNATSAEPFFQRVEVLPVKIKLDYKAKRVDYHALRRGKTAELMNFFNFDASEITLRRLVVTGIAGSTRLSDLVQDIWTQDVKANQLADVISGIGPVRSVVNVGSGVANLVLLPIEQFRKDGRVVRGLQKGATAFALQTTMEALSVGARLATGTQVILEQAETFIGGGGGRSSNRPSVPTRAGYDGLDRNTPSVAGISDKDFASAEDNDPIHMLTDEERQELISRYAAQPSDVREGIESAYRSMGGQLRSAAQTILALPMEVYEQTGDDGPVRAVVRAVPVAVLKPMIGASEAVSKALLGLRNTFDPDSAQIEASDKYKQSSH